MISVEEAHKIINAYSLLSEPEDIPIANLLGRRLAEDIVAPFPQPRFHNAAMDGFAVRYDDVATATKEHPISLQASGELPAGSAEQLSLAAGKCIPIMTGAKMPDGADTVVKVEETSGFGASEISFYSAGKKGRNIRLAGEEIQSGDCLIRKGTLVTPAEIGTLATFGIHQAKAFRKPKLAIIASGSELREPGETLGDGEIYNSNLPLLSSAARFSGAEVVMTKTLRDAEHEMTDALGSAILQADIVVTTGGVSEGAYDFVRTAMEKRGVEAHFAKVAQKPGMPFYFGTKSRRLLFGLPGNPVSAFMNFMEYVYPELLKFAGGEAPIKSQGVLQAPFKCEKKKHRFLFGTVRFEAGELRCTPTGKTGSHMLTAMLGANAILEAPANDAPLPAGEKIIFSLLPWAQIF
ncbi:molybdenum cofactor synthesis domain protein [Chloroherpeton thalassium ATCC 35110]|uniref:Molybdopterin molybdenumtransferase n=1 Tax=Chloroherpeton thalassium (strain ATCC 35110 / GB-78) TaxID=517418 RepID=B3QWW8_CHLT3|nr:gephyrin-like molybdotransferase Glp [Chloroherpeton thalassium]ACF13332.1 molybdenum cofactor synthesis domain protein [Chloroherpeton thalassium ATCC 35110]